MAKQKKKTTYKTIMWLLRTIYRASPNGITRRQINQKWLTNRTLSKGMEYPEKTFHNHIVNIKEIFNINIIRKGHKYKIEMTDNNELTAMAIWMDYMEVNDIVGEKSNIRERIIWGYANSGSKWIQPLLNGIEQSVEILIKYNKKTYFIQPYMLRHFQQRWYLVGRCTKTNEIKFFLLNMLSDCVITANEFIMPSVNKSLCEDAEFLKSLKMHAEK